MPGLAQPASDEVQARHIPQREQRRRRVRQRRAQPFDAGEMALHGPCYTKPLESCIPRIQNIIQRARGTQVEIVAEGDRPIRLPPDALPAGLEAGSELSFEAWALLVRRSGEVLSRTMIAEQVWDMNFNSDSNVVDVHMRRLRMKVDDPFELKLIHTVRGVGYVLEERGC